MVGLLCAAAGATTLAFVMPRVTSPLPRLRSSTAIYATSPEHEFAASGPALDAEVSQGSGFLKWIGAGLLAGVMAAAAATPVSAAAIQEGSPWRGQPGVDWNSPSWDGFASPCGENKKFKKKNKDRIQSAEKRMSKIAPGTVVHTWWKERVERFQRMETNWANRWCDKQTGLPIVLTTFTNERGAIWVPSAIFLYTAGWIGWAGRSYLQRTQDAQKEIFIDVPLAVMCMASGFSWPVTAWQEIVDGKMAVPSEDLPLNGMTGP